MRHRKQKKPSKNEPPSSRRLWKEAKQRFHLSDEQLAMAQAIDFTPALMDTVATGRCIKRSPHDPLPTHATDGQIKKIKREIRARYLTWIGNQERRPTEEANLIVPLPAALKAQAEIECARARIKLADEIRGFLEARFPAAPSPKPPTEPTTEAAPPPSGARA